MNRQDALNKAGDLIHGDRQSDYGPPRKNFQDIADGWSVILNTPVTVEQVSLMMAWLKIARLAKTPSHEDSWIDSIGYLAIGCELSEQRTGS